VEAEARGRPTTLPGDGLARPPAAAAAAAGVGFAGVVEREGATAACRGDRGGAGGERKKWEGAGGGCRRAGRGRGEMRARVSSIYMRR
jgi:hypothetical protein